MSQQQFISLALLDPVHGHSLQSWSFHDRDRIRIGRTAENEVSIDSGQVSRLHAELILEGDVWRVVSHGRNGTLLGNRTIKDGTVHDRDLLQLGPTGPKFEVRLTLAEEHGVSRATIVYARPDFMEFLVDPEAAASEADQVAEEARLDTIRKQAERIKRERSRD